MDVNKNEANAGKECLLGVGTIGREAAKRSVMGWRAF
jgi:hypothetical protein